MVYPIKNFIINPFLLGQCRRKETRQVAIVRRLVEAEVATVLKIGLASHSISTHKASTMEKNYSDLLKLAQISSVFFKFTDEQIGLNVCRCRGLDQMSSAEQTNTS